MSADLFISDWKFNLGDVAGAEQPDFNDSSWRILDLPHDWSIEHLFSAELSASQGFLPGGIGWYRKTFGISGTDKDKIIRIEFDGVYMDSTVWINGHKLGGQPYGYIGFSFDLTPYLKLDRENLLAVRVNAPTPSCRWYSGAGIYRDVRLVVLSKTHIPQYGVYITTPEISNVAAAVRVLAKTANFGPDGKENVSGETSSWVATGDTAEQEQVFKITKPELWSPGSPCLYKAISIVSVNGIETDRKTTVFGIRKIEFTRDRGFFLNDKHVPIKGLCLHHDLGCLGAAANVRAMERQLEILKAAGCNAIRTAHNPPAPQFLDLCDCLGFLVMDEAFDEWKRHKTQFGYWRFFDEWAESDLTSFIRRDRNHPSIIMWSIGNEIPEQDSANGGALATALANVVHREDRTRPVTAGCNHPKRADESGFIKALDLAGINYNYKYYEMFREKYSIFGSETRAALASRGEYHFAEKNGSLEIVAKRTYWHQVSSFNLTIMSGGALPEEGFKAAKKYHWSAGEFAWSGFDYIGEPYLGEDDGEWPKYAWPSRSSYWGLVDLCGFPKDCYYLYQSQWGGNPMVHIFPHWSWPGYEGKLIPVWCYAKCDSVELFLNGKSVGEKKFSETEDLHLEWQVPYVPGTLKALAKINGQEVATDEVRTASAPFKIVLSPDREKITADGFDLSFIEVKITDQNGVTCPECANLIAFTASGPGLIAGVDNGNATCHESFKGSTRSVFHGLALLVIKSLRGQSGKINISASSAGLVQGQTAITSE